MFCQPVLTTGWIRNVGVLSVLWLVFSSPNITARVTIHPVDTRNAALTGLHEALEQGLKQHQFHRAGRQGPLVTIGTAAFRDAIAQDASQPIIAAFITSTQFEQSLSVRRRPTHITAVFSNPDPLAQYALAQILLGHPAVGVFETRATLQLTARLTQHAGRAVRAIPVSPGQDTNALIRTLSPLDALIVLPDVTVINRTNINHVVRSLYQQRKVLIGYSETLTRIGGLASIFPRRDAIIASVIETVTAYYRSGDMPAPGFVRDLDIAVNKRLARSLNIAIPETRALLQEIRERGAAVNP
ncbi:MAG: hypothetical protein ACR2P1_24885 [Pseudomonadales bacterium]